MEVCGKRGDLRAAGIVDLGGAGAQDRVAEEGDGWREGHENWKIKQTVRLQEITKSLTPKILKHLSESPAV